MGFDMMRYQRRALGSALALGLLAGAAACGGSESAAADTAAAAPAPAALNAQDVATVRRAAVASGVVLTGSLQPAEVVALHAQVAGTVQGVRVDRGTPVKRGQVLATISAEGVRGAAAGARAAVAAARAQLAVAQQRLEAARTLHGAGAMADIDLRSAVAAREAAEAQLAAAQAQAAGAGEQAARTVITAPMTGVVSARSVESGEAVTVGADLFEIVNSSVLELSGQIPVAQAARVRVGQPVLFTLDAAPERELRGSVARIDPTADPATRQVGVYVRLPNPGGEIVGGQFARGRILGERPEEALVVPVGAVRGAASGDAHVLAIENGKVARRAVQLGVRDEASGIVAVTTGLAEGDRVIATPAVTLAVGTAVTVAGDTTAAGNAAADAPRNVTAMPAETAGGQ
jgi:RND family efflux transporter MFP subunit